MHVIHALAWYYPESIGGTEVYVSGLVGELATLGITSEIVAARNGVQSADYVLDGVAVHRYPYQDGDLATTRGKRPPQNFGKFVTWLQGQPRGIYHQHTYATSCGLHHIRAAKSLGFKTVLTVHVPANICLRGTMMEFGTDPCDGRVQAERCAACWSHARGLPRSVAQIVSHVPQNISRAVFRSGAQRRFSTLLAAREIAAMRQHEIVVAAGAADRIVAVCAWLADALRLNGIPDNKLVLSRQGVDCGLIMGLRAPRANMEKLRIGFLGRCDPVKGIHVLIEAFKRLRADAPIELNICMANDGAHSDRYRDAILRSGEGDERILIHPPLPHSKVSEFLSGLDVLAVPSQWLETGPLVVLESFAAGTPVIGSDIGGIRELVSHGRDGLLIPYNDVDAWSATLASLASNPQLRESLRNGIAPVRTMTHVAHDMAALYREVLANGTYAI